MEEERTMSARFHRLRAEYLLYPLLFPDQESFGAVAVKQ